MYTLVDIVASTEEILNNENFDLCNIWTIPDIVIGTEIPSRSVLTNTLKNYFEPQDHEICFNCPDDGDITFSYDVNENNDRMSQYGFAKWQAGEVRRWNLHVTCRLAFITKEFVKIS